VVAERALGAELRKKSTVAWKSHFFLQRFFSPFPKLLILKISLEKMFGLSRWFFPFSSSVWVFFPTCSRWRCLGGNQQLLLQADGVLGIRHASEVLKLEHGSVCTYLPEMLGMFPGGAAAMQGSS